MVVLKSTVMVDVFGPKFDGALQDIADEVASMEYNQGTDVDGFMVALCAAMSVEPGLDLREFLTSLRIDPDRVLKMTELVKLPAHLDSASRVAVALRASAPPAAKHGEIGKGRPNNRVDNINSKGGTDPDYALARLKRDRPDLAQQVIDGTLSANAAAIQAGHRKPRVSIPADDPQKAAEAILRRLGTSQAQHIANSILTALSEAVES